MTKPKIIATQIDLARRKENSSEIRAFLDHAHKFGYNTVLFYLEDRIKTVSYPYSSDEESYTPSEMRELVSYASALGIDVIPVVSNHSHCERFLSHEELLPMAELYGNIKGRFNKAGSAAYLTTCPENPLTQDFFGRYYSEIAEIFPSEYFHAGLDESFDIASCAVCRERFEREGSFKGIWLDHVKRTHSTLSALGKKMMIFDDMLYFMPDLVTELPKDIVLCSWNYEYIGRTPGSQFMNTRKIDLLSLYKEHGLEFIPACWTNFDFNVDTITAYGEKYSPLGYLATTWQMTTEPLICNYVGVAYAGLLWNGVMPNDPYSRLKLAVRETLGLTLTEQECSAIAMAASKVYANRPPRNFYFADGALIRRNVNFDEEHKLNLLLRDLLISVPDSEFTRFYKARVDSAIRVYEQLIAAEKLYDYRSGIGEKSKSYILDSLYRQKKETERDIAEWDREWKVFREGIVKDYNEPAEQMLIDCDTLIATAEAAEYGECGALDMQMLLPDKSTRVLITLEVTYSDGSTERLGTGLYKPYATACYNISEKGPYVYTVTFLTKPISITSLTVSVTSYGSATINHFTNYVLGKDYHPTRVVSTFGTVKDPERLLVNDTLSAEIGIGDMSLGFKDPAVADTVHGVTLAFI